MKNNTNIKPIDIVIINDNNLSFLGGERESQLILINELKEKYNMAIIQPGEFNEIINGVKIFSLTKSLRMKYLIRNPFAFINYILRVGKTLYKIHPQIVHSQSQVSFFIISLLKRLHMIPDDIILLHTDRGLYTKYNVFFRRLFQFSFKYLDTLVTTTQFNRDCWKRANANKNIHLNYKVVSNTAGKIYETLDERRLVHNVFLTVGFAGRMCNWKGWPLAVKICEEVNKILPDMHFKMYVSCFNKSDENKTNKMFSYMESLCGNRFEGRINVPFDEMEQFNYDIDIYILTSSPNSESFGRTIVEAMSRMNAVLTTDAGGAVEVVGKKSNVHVNATDFAKHIKYWYENRENLANEKLANLTRVRDKFSLHSNVNGYLTLYESKLKS